MQLNNKFINFFMAKKQKPDKKKLKKQAKTKPKVSGKKKVPKKAAKKATKPNPKLKLKKKDKKEVKTTQKVVKAQVKKVSKKIEPPKNKEVVIQDTPKKKRGRPPKPDKKARVYSPSPQEILKKALANNPLKKKRYLVKLKIDAKTIIFVKDAQSLKKWKAKFPNAEEVL